MQVEGLKRRQGMLKNDRFSFFPERGILNGSIDSRKSSDGFAFGQQRCAKYAAGNHTLGQALSVSKQMVQKAILCDEIEYRKI